MEYFNLNDGNRIPKIGFGTYKLKGASGVAAIKSALNVGYRLLDSAVNYENEGTVGEAIRQSSVARSDIFVTSKLPGRHHDYKEAIDQIKESLFASGLDYFDMYLIHWPNPKHGTYVDAWQALIDAQRFGLVRSIGVSNFEPTHLRKVIAATSVTPAVNQVELHPYWSSRDIREFDNKHGIITQAWSPLRRGNEVFDAPVIKDLADKYHKSSAQIILRWETQMNVVPIPKASSYTHQENNINIFDFELTDTEIASICALDVLSARRFDPEEHEEM